MNINRLTFRKEQKDDYREVETLTREAFWNEHVPGCDEHYLVHILRDADCFIEDLDIVAELDDKIVANIMYSHAVVVGDDGCEYPVLAFGPVSVLPECQRRGIGRAIIEHTKSLAKAMGHKAILIYGDPNIYSKVGFCPAEDFKIGTKYDTYSPALQACELVQGALRGCAGLFAEDELFHLDEQEAKEFDKGFEMKELIKGTESQKRFNKLLKMNKDR